MEKADKLFISINGSSSIGKSVELKQLIYRLSQDERVKSCKVKVAKIKKGDFDFVGNLVSDSLKADNDFCKFLADATSEFIEIKETGTDNSKQFHKCVKECKFSDSDGEHEIDFVAIIEILIDDGLSIEIVICTIGDNDDVVRWNLCRNVDRKAADKDKYALDEKFGAADIIICALSYKTKSKNGAPTKQLKILELIRNYNLRAGIKIKVSESTKIAGVQKGSEKDISVELAVDVVLTNLFGKLVEGLGAVVPWLKGVANAVDGKNNNES